MSSDPSSPPLPLRRPRRMRRTAALRELNAETAVRPADLIAPFFVVPGRERAEDVGSLPGVSRLSVDLLLPQLERALELGIRAVLLFGVVPASRKDPRGSDASDPEGPVPHALREARRAFGHELALITDVCLCGYTDHGHCGVLSPGRRGAVVDNDASLPRLAEMAVVHADAGADLVAPSDMMDGRVAALRQALDTNGHTQVGILSYAVKYASAFYGPFREAAGSAPAGGGGHGELEPPEDRRSYQMDARNVREAELEASLDDAEGADVLMVKPAHAYLDVIARVRACTTRTVAAYHVSGEYAMLEAAAEAGVLDRPAAVRETLLAIRRAGADLIATYYAVPALEQGWLEP
ncbi:MAG: porphobilinogen synthase [Trueperaceae bacterium]|nr:porphobilinogen synthase [Trueperaceae bacterium]